MNILINFLICRSWLTNAFYFIFNYFVLLGPKIQESDQIRSRTRVIYKTNDFSGENPKLYPEDIQDLLNNEWGFKRRERDDVKKPGPRLDAKTLKILYHNKSVTG